MRCCAAHAQVRFLVVPEDVHRQKIAPALLSPAEAAAYRDACAALEEPYKNVVRFDGAPPRSSPGVAGYHAAMCSFLSLRCFKR